MSTPQQFIHALLLHSAYHLGGPELVALIPVVVPSQNGSGSVDFKPILPNGTREIRFESLQDLFGNLADLALEDDQTLLLVPPWGRLSEPIDRAGFSRVRDAHDAAMRYLSTLDLPRVMAILPRGWLTASRTSRSEVFTRLHLRLAIFLDNSARMLPAIHSQFEMAVVGLGEGPGELRLFCMPGERADSQGATNDFRRLLKQGGGSTKHGYVLREPPPADEAIWYERHDPSLRSQAEELAVLGELRSLGDMFDIRIGGGSPRRHEEAGDGRALLISGRDVSRTGRLDVLEPEYVDADPDELLQADDLVLRTIRGPSDRGGLVVAVVVQGDLPATIGPHVALLRPKQPLRSDESGYLLDYLRSKRTSRLLARYAPPGLQLRISGLRQLPVPSLSIEMLESLEHLRDASRTLQRWANDSLEVRQGLFSGGSLAEARRRVLIEGRRTRQRVTIAQGLDDLGYRVRTQFPHPIAYRWRTVEGQRADPRGYGHVLDCFETVICYSALLCLIAGRVNETDLSSMAEVRRALGEERKGTSLGLWTAVLQEARAKLGALEADAPLAPLGSFLRNDAASAAATRLRERRNDESHTRRVDDHEIESAFIDAKKDLEEVLKDAEVLADYTLRLVERSRIDTLEGRTYIEARDLVGDHAVVPLTSTTTFDLRIELDSLYVVEPEGVMHLLRPFLLSRICPTCGTRSTFFPDRIMDGTIEYKSLERGHSLYSDDMHDALAAVGLMQ